LLRDLEVLGYLRVYAGLDSASWAGKPCPTILLAMFRNDRYQELAKAELQKKGLGPYRADRVAVESARPDLLQAV